MASIGPEGGFLSENHNQYSSHGLESLQGKVGRLKYSIGMIKQEIDTLETQRDLLERLNRIQTAVKGVVERTAYQQVGGMLKEKF